MKQVFKNTIFKNFGYLSLLRVFEIVLPLLSYPYLIRVLDISDYGNIIFAQSLVYYFTILINYGFNISATKNIARNNSNQEKLSEIFTSTIVAKLILFFVAILILILVLAFVDFSEKLSLIIKVSFLINIFHLFYPGWYFQGLDKMKLITIINVVSKIVFTAGIFIFVKTQADYLAVPILWVLGSMVSALLALYIVLISDRIEFTRITWDKLKNTFNESSPFFLSNLSVELYVNANKVILGFFLGMKEVAVYDLANKILTIIKIPIITITQSSFPTFAREKDIKQINFYSLIGLSLTIVLIISAWIFAKPIILLLGTESLSESISIMRILVVAALFVSISQFLGTARLVVFGFTRTFSKIIISSAGFYFLLLCLLYNLNSINLKTLAYLSVSVEIWVAVLMFAAAFKKNILYEEKF